MRSGGKYYRKIVEFASTRPHARLYVEATYGGTDKRPSLVVTVKGFLRVHDVYSANAGHEVEWKRVTGFSACTFPPDLVPLPIGLLLLSHCLTVLLSHCLTVRRTS